MFVPQKVIFVLGTAVLPVLAANALGAIVGTSGNVVHVSPPPSLEYHVLESDTEILVFEEVQNFQLQTDITVNIASPGTLSPNEPMMNEIIDAGTYVNCFFLHFDPVGNTAPLKTAAGSLTFDTPIIGVMIMKQQLNNSDDQLGTPGTLYPTGGFNRGLDAVNPGDWVTLESDMRSVFINCEVDEYVDQVRVLTAVPEPAAVFLLALGGFCLLRRWWG